MARERFVWRTKRRPVLGDPRGFELSLGTRIVGRVMYRGEFRDWYWYATPRVGPGHNSLWSNQTYPSAEEAKAACRAHLEGIGVRPGEEVA